MSTSVDDIVDANNSVSIISLMDPAGISGDAAEHQPPKDISRALFNNDSNDTPSQHLCLFTLEPPFDAVYFNVPSTNRTIIAPNKQVYEQSALYQLIATPGTLSAQKNIIQPLIRVNVARNRAWDFVRPVVQALMETLHRQGLALDLLLEDDNPLNEDDRELYDQTMRDCGSR
jgi:hypothetical protein